MDLLIQFFSIFWLCFSFVGLKEKVTPDTPEKYLSRFQTYKKVQEAYQSEENKPILNITYVVLFLISFIGITVFGIGYSLVYEYVALSSSQWTLYLFSIVLYSLLFLRGEVKIGKFLLDIRKPDYVFDDIRNYAKTDNSLDDPLGIKFLQVINTLLVFYFSIRLAIAVLI